MSERAARIALVLLCALAPAVYAVRLFGGSTPEPLPTRPARVHWVVVTTGSWPRGDGGAFLAEHPGVREHAARSTAPVHPFAPSTSAASSAASLWTGRWPLHHGVLDGTLALPPGTWTFAETVRDSGGRTAAFLEFPFVQHTRIGGFDTVEERRDLGPAELARLARAFHDEHRADRTLVWLHLEDPGARTERVGELLELLQADLESDGRRFETVTVVTAFASDAPVGPNDDRGLSVPLWIELPTALYAGRRGRGEVNLVDLLAPLLEVGKLPRPDEGAGDPTLQARDYASVAMKGGGGHEWQLLLTDEHLVLRHGRTRVRAPRELPPAEADVVIQTADPLRDVGFQDRPPGPRGQILAQFFEILRQTMQGRVAAVPAGPLPEAFRGEGG